MSKSTVKASARPKPKIDVTPLLTESLQVQKVPLAQRQASAPCLLPVVEETKSDMQDHWVPKPHTTGGANLLATIKELQAMAPELEDSNNSFKTELDTTESPAPFAHKSKRAMSE